MVKETEDPNLPSFIQLLKDYQTVSLGNRNDPPCELWFQYNPRQSSEIEHKSLGERNQRIVIAMGLEDPDQLRVLVKDSPHVAKTGQKFKGTSFYGYRLSRTGELRPFLRSEIARWQRAGDVRDPWLYALTMANNPSQFSESSDFSAQFHLALMKLGLTISGRFQKYADDHPTDLKPIPVRGGYHLPDNGGYGIKLRERIRFELDSSKKLLPWITGVEDLEGFAKSLHLLKATE